MFAFSMQPGGKKASSTSCFGRGRFALQFFWRLPICVALCEVEERKRRKMQVQALAASIPHSFVAALMCRARTLGCHMQNVRKASWIFKRRGLKLVDTVTNTRCAQHVRAGFGELSLCLKIEVDVV